LGLLPAEFWDRVAHDVRGPVGVTSGALNEIELALGADAEKFRPYFLMAKRGMLRVLRTADRLQRAAQLDGGAVEWAMITLDLRDLAAQAVADAELIEARRGIQVNFTSSNEACRIQADPAWLLAAMGDLLANAIRLARSDVTVHVHRAACEVHVTIRHDGLARSDRSRCDLRGENALVLDVVAAHGGSVSFDVDTPTAAIVLPALVGEV
jgi:signal transduction histidine kinase